MKTIFQYLAVLSLLSVFNSSRTIVQAQGTAFTYQGRLNTGGTVAGGSYDIQFTLYTTNITGSAVAVPVTNGAVAVTNGLFTTTVDFGAGVFTGTNDWLEIAVRTNGAAGFTTLAPRQQVTPTPYALFAPTAGAAVTVSGPVAVAQLSGTISSAQLGGSYSGPVNFLNGSNSFTGNGGGLTNLSLSGIGPAGTFGLQTFYFGPAMTLATPNGSITVKLADLNGDGLPDLIVTSYAGANAGFYIFTNGGGGIFTLASTNVDSNGTVYSVAVGDFNGDGKADIVAGDGNGITIFKGAGNGTFTPVLTNALVAEPYPRLVSVADFAGTGHPGVIVVNGGLNPSTVNTLLNFGAGGFAFTVAQTLTINDTITSATVADVNGDGQPDLIYSSGTGVGVYTNRSGVYTLASTNRVITGEESVTTGDVNGDGRPDLIMASGSGSAITIFTNSGGGIFSSNESVSVGNSPICVVASTNSAGVVSYLGVANGADGTITVLANDGHGNFSQVALASLGGQYTIINSLPLATADLNGDGKPDFVTTTGQYLVTEFLGFPQVLTAANPVLLTNAENEISGYFTGNGSGLANLNASQITSGILPVNQLPPTVALLSSNQVFSGVNTMSNTANSFNGTFVGSPTVNSFSGRAGGLTGLNASQLVGTIPLASIPTPTVVTNNASAVTLSGTFSGNGGGLTNTPTAGNYVFAYDTSTQATATANTYQDVVFASNGQISGWAHTAGQSVFTCGQAGVYLIQYAGVTETTSGGATNSLRVVLNSTEIPGSQSVGTTSLALSPITVGKSVLAALNVADQIKVQFTSGSATGALVTNNGSGTTRPSISVTIIRIQ